MTSNGDKLLVMIYEGEISHFNDDSEDDDDFMAGSDGQYQLARITVLATHAAHSLGYDDASDFDDEDQNVDDSDDDYIE